MLVLMVEPGKAPDRLELNPGLEAMQEAVGGLIQILYPFAEPVALVYNEEGKLLGLPANRALRAESGTVYDIVCGTFFLCGAPPDSDTLGSLTDCPVWKICHHNFRERYRMIELVSVERLHEVIDTCAPKGLFLAREGKAWVAVDNSTGCAWTEEFRSGRKAVRWLILACR